MRYQMKNKSTGTHISYNAAYKVKLTKTFRSSRSARYGKCVQSHVIDMGRRCHIECSDFSI